MGIIAVAGGGGQVGRALVDGLIAHGGHTVYVLSRNNHEQEDTISFVTVNYSDVQAVAKFLEGAKVDTLVCAIGMLTPEGNQAQINLILAANYSSTTNRFVISSYDMPFLPEHTNISPVAKHTFAAIGLLENTGLLYTRIANGWFLDYFGMPYWKTRLYPWTNIVNMEKKWAVVPGDGHAKATFITTQDLGRLFSWLMDIDEWPKICHICGPEITFNDLVKLAEETRRCKFDVAYDSLDKLRSGKISFASEFCLIGTGNIPEEFFAHIHYLAGTGNYWIRSEHSLNEKLPDIKLTTIEEVIEKCWKGK